MKNSRYLFSLLIVLMFVATACQPWARKKKAEKDEPLLLLDDVLSALYASRRCRLMGVLQGFPQAILTATERPQGNGTEAVYLVRRHALTRFEQREEVTAAWEPENRNFCARC